MSPVWQQPHRCALLVFWCSSVLASNSIPAPVPEKSPQQHDLDVSEIAAAVAARGSGQLVTLKRKRGHGHCIRSGNYKNGTHQVDISKLNKIIDFRPLDHPASVPGAVATVVVEPLVDMQQLVRAFLPLGMTPCVVPEFRKITVGGSIQGLAAESSSFRRGFFHDTCTAYEVVLGDGRVVEATASNQHSRLFLGLPGSYGSLGILTAATVAMCPAAEYVKLESRHHETPKGLLAHFKASQNSVQLQEGFGFAPNFFASVEGTYCNSSEVQKELLKRYDAPFSLWFYKSIEKQKKKMLKDGVSVTYVPTQDYMFRHDRGSFWMASFKMHPWIGRVLGPLLSSRRMFQLATALPFAFPRHIIVLQDLMLPADQVPGFVEYLHEKLGLWPLWVLPMRNLQSKRRRNLLSVPHNSGQDWCNVGAYGIPKKKYNFEADNKEIEKELSKRGGRKVFYSHAYYTQEEFFGSLYDGSTYNALRQEYQADGVFSNVYDKVITRAAVR